VVVHCGLERSGRRRVVEILTPTGQIMGSRIEASAIFTLEHGTLEPTGGHPSKMEKFRASGFDPATVLAVR
jgi:pilus assembly protein CpaF